MLGEEAQRQRANRRLVFASDEVRSIDWLPIGLRLNRARGASPPVDRAILAVDNFRPEPTPVADPAFYDTPLLSRQSLEYACARRHRLGRAGVAVRHRPHHGRHGHRKNKRARNGCAWALATGSLITSKNSLPDRILSLFVGTEKSIRLTHD